MQCRNHPNAMATDRCAGCSESFCPECLVEIQGQKYCGACKVMTVQGKPVAEEATVPLPEAKEALTYAIVGIFCFGIILEPIAIHKALKAKKMLAANPRFTGSGQAQAALIIAIVALLLWVLGILAKIATK